MNLLIVEDNKEILEFLTPSLKAEGFVVDSADNGKSGLYKVRINEYDLIILDINLPHKNGREICLEIRSMGKSMPILMLSVNSEIETKVDLLRIGADDYVTKPFSYDELLARIFALMRRPANIEDEILRVGDVNLNIPRRTVHRAGKQIYLSPKEFSLFQYLLRNRGKALSRQMILEHVWDMNADPFTNTIETHIATLRKKIGLINGVKIIHTVSGIGYKIDML